MADIATLGFAVETAPIAQGEKALDSLSNAAVRAEKATQGAAGALDQASAVTTRATGATAAHDAALSQATASTNAHTAALKAEAAASGISAAANDNQAASLARVAAASKMAAFQQRNLIFQLNDVAVTLAAGMNPLMVAMQQGSQIATIYGPGEGGIGRAFKETGKLALQAVGFVGKLALMFPVLSSVTAVAAGSLFNVTQNLKDMGHESITMADTFVAAVQVIAGAIGSVLAPAFSAVGTTVGAAWDWISEKTYTLVNLIINSFTAAAYDIDFVFKSIPTAILAALTGISNMVRESINTAVNFGIDAINKLIAQVNRLPSWMLPGGALPEITSRATMQRTPNIANANLGADLDQRQRDISSIMSSDPLGDFAKAVQAKAISNEVAEIDENTKGAADSAKKLADNWKTVKAPVAEMSENMKFAQETFRGFIGDLRSGLKAGEGFFDAFANAATNALDKIIDRALDLAINSLFNGLAFPSIGAGGNTAGYFGSSSYTNTLAFGGPRAAGGPVDPSKWYMVGEKGPERFIPHTAGSIMPNGSGNSTTVNINNYSGEKVTEKRSRSGGTEFVDIIVGQVNKGIQRGALDPSMGNRFGVTPQARAR